MSFIKGLHDVDNCIKLQKYDGEGLETSDTDDISPLDPSNPRMRICFLDLETTGTDNKEDKIIEIAIKCIEITKENGNDVKVIAAYESLEDPGVPIPESATKINGISDDIPTLRIDDDDSDSEVTSTGPHPKVWKQLSASIGQKSNKLKKILKEAKQVPHRSRKVWLVFMNYTLLGNRLQEAHECVVSNFGTDNDWDFIDKDQQNLFVEQMDKVEPDEL